MTGELRTVRNECSFSSRAYEIVLCFLEINEIRNRGSVLNYCQLLYVGNFYEKKYKCFDDCGNGLFLTERFVVVKRLVGGRNSLGPFRRELNEVRFWLCGFLRHGRTFSGHGSSKADTSSFVCMTGILIILLKRL